MPDPIRAAVPRRLIASLSILVLALGAGCGVSGVTHDDEAAAVLSQCGSPVEGSRYSLCGKLTTAGFGGPGADLTVRGSIDSAPQPSGSRYTIQGGTFHVAR